MTDIGFPWDKLRISYDELSRATSCFSQNNLIGSGSFGSVYKGTLDDGMLIAVKVFNQSEDALESFHVEIEVLKNLRHRNLTKVITGCFAEEFKALVLEYMSNGSLDQWLHSQRNLLDMVQRLNIMIDVACDLDYLHNGYTMPVVHCDLKPANVLLDEEVVAHVCDFSVTKLLTKEESFKHTETLATLGYMAPEYGSTGMISTQCDIYSFGIVVMETFSARRPTDETFGEEMSLKSWISDSLPHHLLQVVDPNLIKADDEDFNAKLQCISSILELALHCADESPEKRLNAEDVVETDAVVTVPTLKVKGVSQRTTGFLENLIKAPRGTPEIEVTFEVDANSILNVQAEDKLRPLGDLRKLQSLTIKAA
ncbi:PREDICTED: probable LRR receptor-like serine/threonine-protein kinase At3g47570 [Ipomoea nil]|uniref:probable LRR receptor-like serine/threonine-protein kinase At3g47570 n=1 Tax=Ipomoea nil TaxID=35883 RepID=UPI0009010D72|nr:PREDICTED: probable LRR receptor-like serine/threonine-protein kinase At3g47570 [Ipomoea nil]